MYRHKPRTVTAVWICELAVISSGLCLLFGFLAAFGR